MAGKGTVDVSEFEKSREQVLKDETGAEWKLAKSFEHTNMYRRVDNESVFKVSCSLLVIVEVMISFVQCVRNMVGVPKEDCKFCVV